MQTFVTLRTFAGSGRALSCTESSVFVSRADQTFLTITVVFAAFLPLTQLLLGWLSTRQIATLTIFIFAIAADLRRTGVDALVLVIAVKRSLAFVAISVITVFVFIFAIGGTGAVAVFAIIVFAIAADLATAGKNALVFVIAIVGAGAAVLLCKETIAVIVHTFDRRFFHDDLEGEDRTKARTILSKLPLAFKGADLVVGDGHRQNKVSGTSRADFGAHRQLALCPQTIAAEMEEGVTFGIIPGGISGILQFPLFENPLIGAGFYAVFQSFADKFCIVLGRWWS